MNLKENQCGVWRCRWSVCTPISCKIVSNYFCCPCKYFRGTAIPITTSLRTNTRGQVRARCAGSSEVGRHAPGCVTWSRARWAAMCIPSVRLYAGARTHPCACRRTSSQGGSFGSVFQHVLGSLYYFTEYSRMFYVKPVVARSDGGYHPPEMPGTCRYYHPAELHVSPHVHLIRSLIC